ncbi:hypothetical protein [Chitinolyticbacter albus]|uniref:hypothetical protein n=1 Tax=Chitinolyticbacter albus TaxID=2961951 RepID=UPI00210869FF|nr:hypothetical protein [Chitinolyticbacter albus]
MRSEGEQIAVGLEDAAKKYAASRKQFDGLIEYVLGLFGNDYWGETLDAEAKGGSLLVKIAGKSIKISNEFKWDDPGNNWTSFVVVSVKDAKNEDVEISRIEYKTHGVTSEIGESPADTIYIGNNAGSALLVTRLILKAIKG